MSGDGSILDRIAGRISDGGQSATWLRRGLGQVLPNGDASSTDRDQQVHPSIIGPDWIEERPGSIALGDREAKTLWVAGYPDAPVDGMLGELLASTETATTDLALHIDPRDTQRTLDRLERRIEELEADVEYLAEKRRAGARGVQADLEDYRTLYDVLRNTSTRAFDVSMYLSTHEEADEELAIDTVRATARRSPANLMSVLPRWSQFDALHAAAPIGLDRLRDTFETTTPMLARAVGSMFPFIAGGFGEAGVEYGRSAVNGSPVVVDRFQRSTGYSMLVIGQLGAGKSFSTKLQLLRRAMYDSDTIIVMLDPMDEFGGVNRVLDGERITVGGSRGLNPMDIQRTPPEVLDAVPDIDPWSEQIAWVMTFFDRFFESVAANPLGDRTQTLRRAVQEAYRRNGITTDPRTHDAESPTITDVIDVLELIHESPTEFGYTSDGEHELVRISARSLLVDLRPSFHDDGDLSNLARPTTFDLDSSVIYLDLQQDEGARGHGQTSLMMQALFNAVYERAKTTEKRVVFAIDEAHYLMSDSGALSFLETAIRHSRHYDLSLQLITQTGSEFALTPEAKTIANLCSMTLIHRVREEAEKLNRWFDLNKRAIEWVRSASAGDIEAGYSEALLGIDEVGWFPIRVRAAEAELDALDIT